MNVKKFKPIEIVKEKFDEKRKNCNYNLDKVTQEKMAFISNMLNNERCFFELKKGIAIEILSYLGFNDSEIFELYDQLTDYELFKGNFEFTSVDDQTK